MIVFPNAKINLGLHVVEKRTDGFHNIETVFYPVNLCDALEIIPGDQEKTEFTISGLPLPGDPETNLVMKVVRLMTDAGSRMPDTPLPCFRIHLHKVIPSGAGLGGGSSDAASALKLVNELWKMDLSVPQLQDLAGQLGSDCAFFIENRPVFATGRGNMLEPIELDLSGYQIVIIVPPVHVSTPEAYRMVSPAKSVRSLKEIIRLPVEEWKDNLSNDFEKPVMNKYPVIREIKEELYNKGALYAAMSGSGSAVYGMFRGQVAVGSLQFDPSFFISRKLHQA